MTAGRLSLIHGNALSIPLADQSVHLVVSSPPYFSLRSYRDGDEHFDGQLGSEATPHHFLAALWAVLDECWRVLRDDGSCWVNLGDKMAGSGGHNNSGLGTGNLGDDRMRSSTLSGGKRNSLEAHKGGDRVREVKATRRTAPDRYNQNSGDLRAKCRMLLPHRFALGLIDPEYRQWTEHRAGFAPTADPPQWICRMDVVWSKLNGLPESVTDRVRASHEYWLHFTKSERYFAAMDEIREDYSPAPPGKHDPGSRNGTKLGKVPGRAVDGGSINGVRPDLNLLGKLPGSVWSVATEPLSIPDDLPQHFAAFPSEFPRRIVLGWSPSGVCVACEQPRRPVCEPTGRVVSSRMGAVEIGGTASNPYEARNDHNAANRIRTSAGSDFPKAERVLTGYACACPTPAAPTTPAVVLDPFSGTGTAPIVAAALGRHGVGVDLSWDYHRIARWRDRDGGLRAKALGVDRPERQLDGQLSLLGGGS